MKKNALTLVLIIIISSFSYSQNAPSTSTKMQEVMHLHDQVMTQMPQIVKLIGQLESKMDGTANDELYENTIADLKDSNQAMVTWMEEFGKRFTANEMYKGAPLNAEKIVWLSEEEAKVIALGEKINASLSNAKSVVDIQ